MTNRIVDNHYFACLSISLYISLFCFFFCFFHLFRLSNTTHQDNVYCRQLLGNDNFDVDLSNACEGTYLISSCQPLYLSVEAVVSNAAQTTFRCTDNSCRYPDSVRFAISAENFGCFSSAKTLISSTVVIVISMAIALIMG